MNIYNSNKNYLGQRVNSLILLTFLITLPTLNLFAVPQSLALNSPVELDFKHPDRIIAGESFELTIEFKKKSNYNFPGSIMLSFSGGLSTTSDNVGDFEVVQQDNKLQISWEELSNSNIIYIPVSVKTDKNQGGVYPVKVSYADKNGLQFYRNIGIFVQSTKEQKPYEPPVTKNPFTVNLVYPAEVHFDETYNLDIVIAKGKNTGEAKVFLQIPPGSKLTINDYTDFIYRQEPGDLSIFVNHMPASPKFTIHCQITNTSSIKSVYPIRASVEFLNGGTISFDDFILVTDTKTAPNTFNSRSTLQSINAATNADTATLFEELDRLLYKWRESTGNYGSAPPQKRTDEQKNETPAQTDLESIFTQDVIFYSIQIAASETVLTNLEQKLAEKGFDEKILEDYDGKIYRYSVGDFETIDQAKALKQELNSHGYPDAFIVEYVIDPKGWEVSNIGLSKTRTAFDECILQTSFDFLIRK